MSESVTGIEIGPEQFNIITRLFEAVETRFLDALHHDEVNQYPQYVVQDRDPTSEQPIARFGLCDNYEEYMRHGMDARYIEIGVPIGDDLDHPFQHLLGSDNFDRFFQVVMRRGVLYEAMTISNFKADNFGSGQTDYVLTNDLPEIALSPAQRLQAVLDTIEDEKFHFVPLRP